MKNRIKFYLSSFSFGIGVLFTLSPFFLYWFIHGSYERYIWIILGPYPFSNFGSGPFQLAMYIGLFLFGIIISTCSFNYLNKNYLKTKFKFLNKKYAIRFIVFILILLIGFYAYNFLDFKKEYTLNSKEIPRPADWQENRISSNHLIFTPNSIKKPIVGEYYAYGEHMSINKVEYSETPEQWIQSHIDLDDVLVNNFEWESKNELKTLRVNHDAAGADGNQLTYYIFPEEYIYIFSYYPYDQPSKSSNQALFRKIVSDQINALSFDNKLETKIYTNDEYSISFEYPKDWRIEEWTDDRFGIGVIKGSTSPRSRMLVSIGTQNRIQTQEELHQSSEVDRNDITEDLIINGNPATLVESISYDGSETTYLKMFIFTDQNTYTVTLQHQAENFDHFKEVFKTIYKSFETN